ncbi:MAG: hypothetical protein RBQ99_04555 [Trichlorobacter sp.]|nr:hypothetical protein [Trichlorobacter sp.]
MGKKNRSNEIESLSPNAWVDKHLPQLLHWVRKNLPTFSAESNDLCQDFHLFAILAHNSVRTKRKNRDRAFVSLFFHILRSHYLHPRFVLAVRGDLSFDEDILVGRAQNSECSNAALSELSRDIVFRYIEANYEELSSGLDEREKVIGRALYGLSMHGTLSARETEVLLDRKKSAIASRYDKICETISKNLQQKLGINNLPNTTAYDRQILAAQRISSLQKREAQTNPKEGEL